jgi:cell division protease FtsH
VTGMLGGRVSEEIFIGEIGTGAFDDFRKATSTIRAMIMEYGMSDKLGPMQFGHSQGQVFLGRDLGHEQNYSDQIAYEIDQEMQNMIRGCYERAREILEEHKDEVHLIAQTLLKKETLEKDEIQQLLEQGHLNETPDIQDDMKVKIQGQDQKNQANKLDFDKEKNDEEPK